MRLTRTLDSVLSSPAKVKLLRLMAQDPRAKSGRALARDIGMSHAQVSSVLDELHRSGLVRMEKIGRAHAYSLQRGAVAVTDLLLPLFERERDLPEELARRIVALVHTPTIAVALFGSVAQGVDHADSDLDLAFVVRTEADRLALEDELAGTGQDVHSSNADSIILTLY